MIRRAVCKDLARGLIPLASISYDLFFRIFNKASGFFSGGLGFLHSFMGYFII